MYNDVVTFFSIGGYMLLVKILPEDLPTIRHERFYHPQPLVMIRMHVLALYHAGESIARIAELLDRSPKNIRDYLKMYRDGGLPAIFQIDSTTLPPDSKLLSITIIRLAHLALEHGIMLRQSYTRKAKEMVHKASGYIITHQFRRSQECIQTLKNWLGRVLRDIERKQGDKKLSETFLRQIEMANRLLL